MDTAKRAASKQGTAGIHPPKRPAAAAVAVMASAGSLTTRSWSHRSWEGITDMPSIAAGHPVPPAPRPVPAGADPAQPSTATAEEGCREDASVLNAGAGEGNVMAAATTGACSFFETPPLVAAAAAALSCDK